MANYIADNLNKAINDLDKALGKKTTKSKDHLITEALRQLSKIKAFYRV